MHLILINLSFRNDPEWNHRKCLSKAYLWDLYSCRTVPQKKISDKKASDRLLCTQCEFLGKKTISSNYFRFIMIHQLLHSDWHWRSQLLMGLRKIRVLEMKDSSHMKSNQFQFWVVRSQLNCLSQTIAFDSKKRNPDLLSKIVTNGIEAFIVVMWTVSIIKWIVVLTKWRIWKVNLLLDGWAKFLFVIKIKIWI